MNKTPGDWMMERERDASARLDEIRRAALAPERASLGEALASVFSDSRGTWCLLVATWILLAAIHFAAVRQSPPSTVNPLSYKALEALAETEPDEAISPLDHHS
jgi:hypothetical protein